MGCIQSAAKHITDDVGAHGMPPGPAHADQEAAFQSEAARNASGAGPQTSRGNPAPVESTPTDHVAEATAEHPSSTPGCRYVEQSIYGRDFPKDLTERIVGHLSDGDRDRFADTSQYGQHAVHDVRVRDAKTVLATLMENGRIDQTAIVTLPQTLKHLEPDEVDTFIQNIPKMTDERARARTIMAAVRDWADRSAQQRDGLLHAASGISDKDQREFALSAFSLDNVLGLSDTRQLDWANGVSKFPDSEFASVISKFPGIVRMSGAALQQLRVRAMRLPPGSAARTNLGVP